MAFYRYAVRHIPSNAIRIPLKVFSGIGPEGMIRLPEQGVVEDLDQETEDVEDFHDEDDDIPPPPPRAQKVKLTESEAEFFDVSDEEEEEEHTEEGTRAWRD